ncbi:MAG: hypothetical protein QXJ27_04705, partial [Thermoplasmata archaeon]
MSKIKVVLVVFVVVLLVPTVPVMGEKPSAEQGQSGGSAQNGDAVDVWTYTNLTSNASISPRLCYAFGTLYAVWAEGSVLWFA